MNNPRTRVRIIVRDVIEDCGDDMAEVFRQVVERVMDDDLLVEHIVRSAINGEIRSVAVSDNKMPKLPVKTPTLPPSDPQKLPAIKTKDSIMIDMASMTRIELIPFAEDMERESDQISEHAAFVRSVAKQLGQGERVKDRFTREQLLAIRHRTSVINTRRYFIDNNEIPRITRKELE